MSTPDSGEEDTVVRRQVLSQGIGFVLNAYLQSRTLLNPTAMALGALNQYGQQQDNREGAQLTKEEGERLAKQEAEMRAMVSQIENLKATFEDGRLVVHLDRAALLGLIERKLRQSLAIREAAMTASFNVNLSPAAETDHEGELALANRSIYLKFVPMGKPAIEFAVLYLERARNMNPSEFWLLVPSGGSIDIPMEPVFNEKGISRGRLRTFDLTSLLGDLVGKEFEVAGSYDPDGGFSFIISKAQPEPAASAQETQQPEAPRAP